MSCRSNFDSPQHLRISVEFENSRFVIALNRADVSFAEVVSQLAFIIQRPPERLRTQRFVCAGCQRTLFAQRERRERLPADCCPTRGLHIQAQPEPDFGDSYVYAELDKTPTSTPAAERRVYVPNKRGKNATLRPHSVTSLVASVKRKSATLPSKRRSHLDPNSSSTATRLDLFSTNSASYLNYEELSAQASISRENREKSRSAEELNLHSINRSSDHHYEELENDSSISRKKREGPKIIGENLHSINRSSDQHYEELENDTSFSRRNQERPRIQGPNLHFANRSSDFHYEELENHSSLPRRHQEGTKIQGINQVSMIRTSDFHYEELEDQSSLPRQHQGRPKMTEEVSLGFVNQSADFEYNDLDEEYSISKKKQQRPGMTEEVNLQSVNISSDFEYEELGDDFSNSRKNPSGAVKGQTFIEIGNGEPPSESDVDGEVLKAETARRVFHSPSDRVGVDTQIYSDDVYAASLDVNDSAPILDSQHESSNVVQIQLTIPDCEPLSISLARDLTLAKFLEMTMINRKWFPVADITATSCGSLLAVSEAWRNWTLDDCGVGDGDKVNVVAAAAHAVHVSLFCPSQFEALQTEEVELDKADWNWGRIQARVAERFRGSLEAPYPSDLTYQIQVLDGCLGMLFLESPSGLIFEASEPPQICILKDTDVLLVSNRDLEWALPTSVSLFEGRWLLLLSGIATSDLRPAGMFVALDTRRFVSVSSGQVFSSREAAIASLPGSFQEGLRGFVMLLEAGNRVPRWRLPRDTRPQLWVRRGRALEVREGRVRAVSREEVKVSESAWLQQAEESRLAKDFARAARKS